MNAFTRYEKVLSICLPRKLRKDVVCEVMDGLYAELEDVKNDRKELSTDELMDFVLLRRCPPYSVAAEYRAAYHLADEVTANVAIRATLRVSVVCAIFFTLSAMVSVIAPEPSLSIRLAVLVIAASFSIVTSSLMFMNKTHRLVPALTRFNNAPVALGRILWALIRKPERLTDSSGDVETSIGRAYAWTSINFYALARIVLVVVALIVLIFAPRLIGIYFFPSDTGPRLAVYPVLTHEFLHVSRPLVAIWLIVLAIGTGISDFSSRPEVSGLARIFTKSIGVCIGTIVLMIGNIFGQRDGEIGIVPLSLNNFVHTAAPYFFRGLVVLCWIGVCIMFLSLLRDVFNYYHHRELSLTI